MDYLKEQNWPMPDNRHSKTNKIHLVWLKQITAALNTIQTRVQILEEENKTQAITITQLKNEIIDLKATATVSTTSIPGQATFSSIVANNNKKSEAEMVMLTKVAQKFKERLKIENNIIISGLTESQLEDQEDRDKEDLTKVERMLEVLGVEKSKFKRSVRMRKRIRPTEANEETDTETITRPGLMIVELKDSDTKHRILFNSRELAKQDELRNVYINQDRTPT